MIDYHKNSESIDYYKTGDLRQIMQEIVDNDRIDHLNYLPSKQYVLRKKPLYRDVCLFSNDFFVYPKKSIQMDDVYDTDSKRLSNQSKRLSNFFKSTLPLSVKKMSIITKNPFAKNNWYVTKSYNTCREDEIRKIMEFNNVNIFPDEDSAKFIKNKMDKTNNFIY